MTTRVFLAALACLAVAALAPPAHAQQTPPPQTPQQHGDAATMNEMQNAANGAALDAQARSHFRVGLTLYQEGRFRDSAAEFQQAYDLSHRSQLLYNVYLAWRDAGDVPKSTEALRQFLGETPDDGSDQRRALTARLASLQESVQQQQQQTAASEQQHQQELAAQAAEAERQRQAAEEAQREAADAQRRAAEAASHRPLGPSVPGLVVGGVGLAAVVAGVIIGGVGLSQAGDLSHMCTGTTCPATAKGTQDSARLMTGLGDALWMGGAAIAITGLILFLLHVGSSPEGPPPPVTATAGCGPNGCSAALSWHL